MLGGGLLTVPGGPGPEGPTQSQPHLGPSRGGEGGRERGVSRGQAVGSGPQPPGPDHPGLGHRGCDQLARACPRSPHPSSGSHQIFLEGGHMSGPAGGGWRLRAGSPLPKPPPGPLHTGQQSVGPSVERGLSPCRPPAAGGGSALWVPGRDTYRHTQAGGPILHPVGGGESAREGEGSNRPLQVRKTEGCLGSGLTAAWGSEGRKPLDKVAT